MESNLDKLFKAHINPDKYSTVAAMYIAYHQKKDIIKRVKNLTEEELNAEFLNYMGYNMIMLKPYVSKDQPYGWAYSKVKSIFGVGLRLSGYMDFNHLSELAMCAVRDGELREFPSNYIKEHMVSHIEILPEGMVRDYVLLKREDIEIIFSFVDYEDRSKIPSEGDCNKYFIVHAMNDAAKKIKIVPDI